MSSLGLPIFLGLLLLVLSAALYLLAWLVAALAFQRPEQFATLAGRAEGVMESVKPLALVAFLGLAALRVFLSFADSSDGDEVQFAQKIAPLVTITFTTTFALMLVGWLFYPILLARALRERGDVRGLIQGEAR